MSSASKKIKDCSYCQKYLQEELGRIKDWEVNRKRIIEEVKNSAWDCPNFGSRHDIVDYKDIHHYQYCQDKNCIRGCWVRVNHLLACDGKPTHVKKREKCPTCKMGGNITVIPTSDGIISISCDKCHTMITSNNGFGDSNINNHSCEQLQASQSANQIKSNQIKSNSFVSWSEFR